MFLASAAKVNGSMPPPPARVKADDDDIFGDAGTDYVCELPKVNALLHLLGSSTAGMLVTVLSTVHHNCHLVLLHITASQHRASQISMHNLACTTKL